MADSAVQMSVPGVEMGLFDTAQYSPVLEIFKILHGSNFDRFRCGTGKNIMDAEK
jgi:hypothetical protein